jgi:VanZ family protein
MTGKLRVRVWLVVVFALLVLMLWGGLSDEDPLARYVADDADRHLLGFGTLGFVAAFVRQTPLRAAAMVFVLGFALAFEVMQGPFSSREASFDDFTASVIGALAGFGLGAFVIITFQTARDFLASRKK